MNSNEIQLTADGAESFCNRFYNNWRTSYGKNDYQSCNSLVEEFIVTLKPFYKKKSLGPDGELYSYIYIFLILSKGLGDVSDLATLTKDKTWPNDHKKTELIWFKLWDAKERLDYFNNHYLDTGLIDDLQIQLNDLESFFYEAFGRGIYASPEILILKAECSVCGKNIKACMHIPNNIYAGIPCKENVVDMKFLNVSLVQSPYDMRCRLWSWNMTEDFRITARIMNLDTIDGFIREP